MTNPRSLICFLAIQPAKYSSASLLILRKNFRNQFRRGSSIKSEEEISNDGDKTSAEVEVPLFMVINCYYLWYPGSKFIMQSRCRRTVLKVPSRHNTFLEFLREILPVLLEDEQLATRQVMWFQLDGAPARFARSVRQFLNTYYPQWIGRGSRIA
ncbi:intraflagellar transport protein 22 [Aphis craccivora]|uniref:Intraflagellar transport protein 22 n=1 Tax=Aphis craccivora TaxID=307492 RepID=A0A6G0WHA0_APHCR|nr:intraflagellar transport protein 22 [Aphis craccivora]